MYENPISLEESCLNVICDNILTYIEPQIQTGEEFATFIEGSDCYDDEKSDKRYKFRDPDIFLINKISEKLLNTMVKKKILCDATLNVFSSRNTLLKTVRLGNSKVTKCGLQILKEHKIIELDLSPSKNVSVANVIDCLSHWSSHNLKVANFSQCNCTDLFRVVPSSWLENLKALNMSSTELDQITFAMMCECLKSLEKLDISTTLITDLNPLEQLSSTLTSLSLCDMVEADGSLIPILEKLPRLKFLDISLYSRKEDRYKHAPVVELITRTDLLPQLEYLDLSGWGPFIYKPQLMKFIKCHPKLNFLGLLLCSVAFDLVFHKQDYLQRTNNLQVAGLGSEAQILVALQYYKNRCHYVQKALYHLFQLTSSFMEARPDILKLVMPAMEAHPDRFGVQMAATACLYNLTRGELSKRIHPHWLSKGVHLTLVAMDRFPDEFQLQKNSLLTLCSDRILQEITFDRFRCAKLVLDALCGFEDVNMNRMAVAICSILASKVSTEETSELGARPVYMRKLLSMVQSRAESSLLDITMKFTLSALWNLTDESPATCAVFLNQGGDILYLKVLEKFKGNTLIETKVLGLLNNIAEVERLRERLLTGELISTLYGLLQSENIDVSYFAAGIVAHLTSDGDIAWSSCKSPLYPAYPRSVMLDALAEAVSQWEVPESEMVAYRSFRPFFPLLRMDMDYQVQLWAVWAIHHVCSKSPARYCHMLYEERGHTLLNDLMNCGIAHPDIQKISQQILLGLKGQGLAVC